MLLTVLFEIWENPEDHSFEMSMVTERGDQLRSQIAPRSVLRHSFRAKSDFEAYQMTYDWHGRGEWKDETNGAVRIFTAEEVVVQEQYIAIRSSL